MLSGFNTNIRHRDVLFHVQTEDSGVRNPHIITHLYHHGTILASQKSQYTHLLDSAELEAEVKGLMEVQHKSMLKKLRAGGFDSVIDDGSSLRIAPIVDIVVSPRNGRAPDAIS